MENSENVEKHQNIRVRSTDDAQDREIADLREDVGKLTLEVNRLTERLQRHNERHYLLMGIIATVSFLAGMGIRLADLFK